MTHDDPTDEDLMARIQSGDRQAFSLLVKRHTRRFYSAAYRLCTDAGEAEDIVQEAFLKLWRKPKNWNASKDAKFTTWFYKVIYNQTMDVLRKKRPDTRSDIIDSFVDLSNNQEQSLQDKSEQDALETAIRNLPQRQKIALNLCVYDELSNKEAAGIMGVRVKALESLLMRAKASLKNDLLHQGVLKAKEESYGS